MLGFGAAYIRDLTVSQHWWNDGMVLSGNKCITRSNIDPDIWHHQTTISFNTRCFSAVKIKVCFTSPLCVSVTDLSTGRVGAPLICNDIMLRDWVEGRQDMLNSLRPRLNVLQKNFSNSFSWKSKDCSLRGGMAPSGVIFHENVNFLFVAQKCQVIHAFHEIHKQNMIAVSATHTLGIFINDLVFGDQRVSTKKRRWWAAFSSIFWNIYSQYRMPFNIGI